jgi:hypothetical protein
VTKLYLITSAYSLFAKRKLYRDIAKSKIDYRDAEMWAQLGNFMFRDIEKKATPQDFIHDPGEMADKSIDKHNEYMHVLELADRCSTDFGLSSKAIDAFCKSVKYGYKDRKAGRYRYKCIMLNTILHVQYPVLLANYIAYMAELIGLPELKKQFVWVVLTKLETVNIRHFLRDMTEIEDLYREIEEKQNRRIKTSI